METGLSPLDLPLSGGLPKGGMVELVCPAQRAGASTMMALLLRHRASHNQWSALIDGGDQFDVQSAGTTALANPEGAPRLALILSTTFSLKNLRPAAATSAA